jgi:polyribonucleotide nucleotidyltransferase
MDIEDDGRVNIISNNPDQMAKAVHWVKELAHEGTAGEI